MAREGDDQGDLREGDTSAQAATETAKTASATPRPRGADGPPKGARKPPGGSGPPPRRRGGGASGGVALVLALIALLATGGLAWLLYHTEGAHLVADTDWEPRLDRLEAELGRARDDTAAAEDARRRLQRDLRGRIDTLEGTLAERDQRLSALAATQREQARRLEQVTPDRVGDWQLAEAEYLLQLAEQRLLLLRDPGGTLRLLQAADERLRLAGDAGLFPVRERLAADMTALAAVRVPDVEGHYLRLRALADQAAGLPLDTVPRAYRPESRAVEGNWRERLLAVLARFGDQVRVQRRDTPMEPLLAPEQEALLRLRLQLQFEQAGAALLAGSEPLFRDSLARIDSQLDAYAATAPDARAAMGEALAELAAAPLRVDLPDISDSRRQLRAWLDARMEATPAEEGEP